MKRKAKIKTQGGKELKRSQLRGARAERRRDETITLKTKGIGRSGASRGGAKAARQAPSKKV